MKIIKSFLEDESGATAIEYGLIATLMVVAVIAAIGAVGDSTTEMYERIGTAIETATGG